MPSTPNTSISAVVRMPPATTTPDDRAERDAGPQPRRMPRSTAPLAACPRTERAEVKTMVASEVARQTCMICGPS